MLVDSRQHQGQHLQQESVEGAGLLGGVPELEVSADGNNTVQDRGQVLP